MAAKKKSAISTGVLNAALRNHKTAEQVIKKIADEQGWDDGSCLTVCLEFINTVADGPARLEQVARRIQTEENEG